MLAPVELTDDGRGRGVKGGVKSYVGEKKPGPLKIIQYSLATVQAKHLIAAFFY